MKRLALLLALFGTLVIAGQVPAAKAVTWTAYFYGYCNGADGYPCYHTPGLNQFVIRDKQLNVSSVGTVGSTNAICSGQSFNWSGHLSNAPFGCNNPVFASSKADMSWSCSFPCGHPPPHDFEVWMRKTCPNGGFLFSLTKTKNSIENNFEVFLGVQTIVDPGGGCFQSIGAQRLYETVMGITY